MSLSSYSVEPGHHHFVMQGPNGAIEIGLSIPQQANYDFIAVVGHPHPLQEGTMNNKVVTTTAKAIYALDIPVIRFNFRGVGQSEGTFAHGVGECEDMLAIIKAWQSLHPKSKLLLSGFSFGSYVATLVAQNIPCQSLMLIAPPVGRFNFSFEQLARRPDLIVMGTQDEVVEPKAVLDFAQSFSPPIPIAWFEDTTHFFHGKLILLRDVITDWIGKCLKESL